MVRNRYGRTLIWVVLACKMSNSKELIKKAKYIYPSVSIATFIYTLFFDHRLHAYHLSEKLKHYVCIVFIFIFLCVYVPQCTYGGQRSN